MDYRISYFAKLFDELLEVLDKYQNAHPADVGAAKAYEDLRMAKANYVQRSMDHMMTCLLLALHDLITQPPSEASPLDELKPVIQKYYQAAFQVPSRFSDLAHEYEASGGKLLSHDEILAEVAERRGTSR
jgi:hypothetical protein